MMRIALFSGALALAVIQFGDPATAFAQREWDTKHSTSVYRTPIPAYLDS
jgi:hypothetical protein